MADIKTVQHIRCTSADEFLEKISLRSSYLKNSPDDTRHPNFFIYRGHADDNWKLIPRALRLGQTLQRFTEWGSVRQTSDGQVNFFSENDVQQSRAWGTKEQIQAEWRLLERFFQFADINGLPLPEDSQQLRRLLLERRHQDPNEMEGWPRLEFLSLLALGQHHGLPTRLLDWTRSSFIAAYFAAEEAARRQKDGDHDFNAEDLSVWAYNQLKPKLERPYGDTQRPLIEIVTAPGAGNSNLHAQKGLFTLVRSDLVSEIDRRPIDEIIQFLPTAYDVLHFILPVSEAPELLGLLSHQDITGATVYPGYDGVAKAVFEERFSDRWS